MHPHIHTMQFKIAIVDANILACMGLQRVLCNIIPMAEIVVCESLDELATYEETEIVHYFVSSRIYFEHTQYFRSRKGRCIVMVSGEMSINGVSTLNVCQSEAGVIHDLLALHKRAHHRPSTNGDGDMEHHARMPKPVQEPQLSQREAEVAILLCQGCINKEVADKLNISLTTVITHRKNIMDKLGARSLADVIIYCVMNGLYHV